VVFREISGRAFNKRKRISPPRERGKGRRFTIRVSEKIGASEKKGKKKKREILLLQPGRGETTTVFLRSEPGGREGRKFFLKILRGGIFADRS